LNDHTTYTNNIYVTYLSPLLHYQLVMFTQGPVS